MNDHNIISTIRLILLRDWDPLIIGDNPHLSDEYDDIIPSIVRLLRHNVTPEQLESYLKDIEKRWKSTSIKQTVLVAKAILEATHGYF